MPRNSDQLSELELEVALKNQAHDELPEFKTSEAELRLETMVEFDELLAGATCEEQMFQFLKEHPEIVAGNGRSGHGEYVIPKPKLGTKHVADFFHAHGTSMGLFWSLIELESPKHCPFNKDGSFSAPLRKAIEQVQDWRTWLLENLDYARKPRVNGGLGYLAIRPAAPAFVVIGRRREYPPRFNELRRLQFEQNGIHVISYDGYVEQPRSRAAFWSSWADRVARGEL